MDVMLSIVFQLRPCGNIIIRLRGGKKKGRPRRKRRPLEEKQGCPGGYYQDNAGSVITNKGWAQHRDEEGGPGSLVLEQMLYIKGLNNRDVKEKKKKDRKKKRNCYKWKVLLRYWIKLLNIIKHPFCKVIQQ